MQKVTDPQVLAILQAMTFDGNLATLNCGQIDPKLYKKVDAVLKALQGKWNRHKGGHVFPVDAREAMVSVLGDGKFHDLKRDDNLFETPDPLVAKLIEYADVRPGMTALEPSAGRGAIVRRLVEAGAAVHAVEKNEVHYEHIVQAGAETVDIADFLDHAPMLPLFDVVAMNPPFAKQADVAHVMAAYKLVKPGGVLVAIMSPGWTFRTNKSSKLFKALVEENGDYEENPEGAFKEAGTGIKTVTVTLRRSA